MKSLRFACICFALAAMTASAAGLDGNWKAVFTCPVGERPKTVSEMIFQLNVKGDKITGTAHIGSWPGDAEISEGTVDGDHFSFTVVGHYPWSGGRGGVLMASGYPKLVFTGTLNGDDMKLHVEWGSIMITGEAPGSRAYDMKSSRLETQASR